CEAGLCVGGEGTTTTMTTIDPPGMCGDGAPAPGEVCFLPAAPLGMGSGPISVVVADFNKDGSDDIACANNMTNNVTVRTGKGNGEFNALFALAVGMGPYYVAAPDLNNDGAADLVTANQTSDDISVYQNNGAGMLIGQPAIPAGA